ncbi:hypothetical protein [Streptomyces sp. NPDC054834]
MYPDDSAEFIALKKQVRTALKKERRKNPNWRAAAAARCAMAHRSQLMPTTRRAPRRSGLPLQWMRR